MFSILKNIQDDDVSPRGALIITSKLKKMTQLIRHWFNIEDFGWSLCFNHKNERNEDFEKKKSRSVDMLHLYFEVDNLWIDLIDKLY